MMNFSYNADRKNGHVGITRLWQTVLALLISAGMVMAQEITVTGVVTDASGSGMPGVAVTVKGTSRGANTDVDGRFSVSAPGSATLVFSFVGYVAQEIPVNNRSTIDIKLAEDTKALEEVVVVGYGTQKRKEISGTVSSISSKEFNSGFNANPLAAVQGKVAGLVISQTGSDPNATAVVRLRGVGSLSAGSDPLYVVDGVPGVPIQNISPNDIETIDVLRDASSAAIYGSRASNGVIIITTKRGRSGRASVDYNGFVGVDQIAKAPAYMNAEEYRAATQKFGFNVGADDKGADTNWFEEITRKAIIQSHNLAFTGGTENFSYRASLGYLGQQGVVKKSNYERISARINLDQTALNGKLKISTSLSAILGNRDFINYEAFSYSITNRPTDPVYTTDPAFQTPSRAGYFERLGDFSIFNPVALIDNTTNEGKSVEYLGNMNLRYNLTKDLVIGANGALKGYQQNTSYYLTRVPKSGVVSQGLAQISNGPAYNAPTDDKLLELTLNYNKTLGNLNIGALGGYSYQDVSFASFSARNSNFISDEIGFDNLGAGAGLALGQRTDAVGSFRSNYKLISFFGRVTAALNEKYFATMSLRRDGSTKFGANNKWGLFPAASVGWTVSNEEFLKTVPAIDNLKFRVNYGQTGNSEGIRPYTTLALLGAGARYYDNGNWLPSYRPIQNPNPDLKWEVNENYGAGIDFSLFNYRLSGSMDYFIRNTRDLLYEIAAPLSIRPIVPNILANVGSMRNQGFELSLDGLIIDKGDFKWQGIIAGATLKNEVVALSKGEFLASDAIFIGSDLGAATRGTSNVPFSIIRPGYPVGALWGARVLEIDDQGKYVLEDINGDGVIDENASDRTFIGNPLPKVTASMTNNFTYKNFNLSFLLNGNFGNKIYNAERMQYERQVGRIPAENTLKSAVDSPIRDDRTGSIDYFVEDGSFVRLANFQFAYNIPVEGKTFTRAQVYLSGNNLFVLTKFKGVDPELSTGNSNSGIYTKQQFPKSRGFQLGVNLSF
ncbi:SusC/RagA family TonB-linked outer membrane protein [Arundinibacter roseus]|uniref:TonB-dependent receptor n=1 Tax=Arundinibacter roseus TaxID=2070510 RepID=A0A4R4K1I3_9BACT|nr:TonB-dependent receptor [Arundinibacter roseus]TDB59849.1 TonB-dependent receptor [Arundinibacter roseus]